MLPYLHPIDYHSKEGVDKEVKEFEPLDGAGNYVKWADTWGNSLT